MPLGLTTSCKEREWRWLPCGPLGGPPVKCSSNACRTVCPNAAVTLPSDWAVEDPCTARMKCNREDQVEGPITCGSRATLGELMALAPKGRLSRSPPLD